MNKLSLKAQVSQLYKWILKSICSEYNENDLMRPALVFSPHFDDETLGCGGLIFKKKRAGADVKIVFMTDGSQSHKHLISENELKAIRANEGLAAAQSLGLPASDVFCLDFEETKLKEYQESAIAKVTKILWEQQPEEIFIPYSREPLLWSEDHLATTRIVKFALKSYPRDAIVYEYPIWFWFHWPWVSLLTRNYSQASLVLKHSLIYSFGLRLLQDFRYFIYIGDVLEHKHAALDQHKSQMTRLVPDLGWPTLSDVSNGEFLKCFFQDREMFKRYHHSGI